MKILLLTHRVPHPPNRGDRIRSYHLLESLAAEHEVYLGALADEPVTEESWDVLDRLCCETAIEPVDSKLRWVRAAMSFARGNTATVGLFQSARLRRRIRVWARTTDFDAILVFCSSMMQYAELPELAEVPVVVDLVDVDSQKWLDYAGQTNGLKGRFYSLEGRRLRRLEQSLPERAQAITLVSQAEASLYCEFCPNDRTHAIGNGVDLDFFSPASPMGDDESPGCVFVGVLDYQPNVQGLRWFAKDVWPKVREQSPQATFSIVGRQPAPAVISLGQTPGIHLVGEVSDVRPYVANARVVVVPLQMARGVQNKVLEAMAMAKPVVASTQAIEGLSLASDVHVLTAKTPEQWSEAILGLFRDREACRRLGQSAREFVQAYHSWSSCLRPLNELLRSTRKFTSAQRDAPIEQASPTESSSKPAKSSRGVLT